MCVFMIKLISKSEWLAQQNYLSKVMVRLPAYILYLDIVLVCFMCSKRSKF